MRNEVAELMLGDESGKAADYANYFSSYAYLYHQKQMLSDRSRMNAYRDAILENKSIFAGRRVLDVGAGSGILSIWAARAGASKVYAVEFTSMATHARRLVKANGLSEVIDVRQCAVEALQVEKVDIIISEWMGYLLLRESMLDSVIYARDHLLKKGGAVFPNRAVVYWAPVHVDRDAKLQEKVEAMADFEAFADEMQVSHGVDVSCLRGAYDDEQTKYYLKHALWFELEDEQVLAKPALVATFDVETVTLEQARSITADFDFDVPLVNVAAFAGWFDVFFDSAFGQPLEKSVVLSTAPAAGYTHWGQQCFLVEPAPEFQFLTTTAGTLTMTRMKDSVRLYDVHVSLQDRSSGAEIEPLSWLLS